MCDTVSRSALLPSDPRPYPPPLGPAANRRPPALSPRPTPSPVATTHPCTFIQLEGTFFESRSSTSMRYYGAPILSHAPSFPFSRGTES